MNKCHGYRVLMFKIVGFHNPVTNCEFSFTDDQGQYLIYNLSQISCNCESLPQTHTHTHSKKRGLHY